MNSLKEKLIVWFYSEDKRKHFWAGWSLSCLGFVHPSMLSFGFVAGVAKEVYDKLHPDKHTSDWEDAVVTFMGAGLAVFTYFNGFHALGSLIRSAVIYPFM